MEKSQSASSSNIDDSELLVAARAGDDEAISQLFRRHHAAAERFATGLAGRTVAPDLVAESFAKILNSLRNGRGPDVAFRAYLFATIRTVRVDHLRRDHGEIPVEEVADVASAAAFATPDGADERAESDTAARAFRSLPHRWQTVLWHTAVEKEPHEIVAAHLGIKANAVAALSFRAREGLRQAYLVQHLAHTTDARCRSTADLLPRHVRGGLPHAQATRVAAHLDQCAACTGALADLDAINTNLGALLAPSLLGMALSHPALATRASARTPNGAGQWRTRAGIALALGLALAFVFWAAFPNASKDRSSAPGAAAEPDRAPVSATTISAGPSPSSSPSSGLRPVAPAAPQPAPQPVRAEALPQPPRPTTTSTVPRTPVSTPEPTPIPFDVAVGSPALEQLTTTSPAWFHVALPISGGGRSLTMSVWLANVHAYEIHTDHAFGAWQCTASTVTGSGSVLDCLLAAQPDRTQDFAMDLDIDGATALDPALVEAVVRLGSGSDPNLANNAARTILTGP
jgi:RNA polymerase sigma factor (sigma-70 family)